MGIIIVARLISGLSGLLALSYATKYLTAIQFSDLVRYQTIQFIILIVFDAGIVKEAILRVSGENQWMKIAGHFQGIRVLIHFFLVLIIILVLVLRADDGILPIYAAFAILSNVLNIDWILISQDRKKIWAIKSIIFGLVNVFVTIYLLKLASNPEAIFIALIIANCTSAIYVYTSRCMPSFFPNIPSLTELRAAISLSSTDIVTHSAYNMPLLIATTISPVQVGSSFACLYRVFSSLTLFIPPVTDFRVAQIIRQLKVERLPSMQVKKVFLSLLIPCLVLLSPVLFLPNDILYHLISFAIDLKKFSLATDSLIFIKCALIFYCTEYCILRTSYIFGKKLLMLNSAVIGFLFTMIIAVSIYKKPEATSVILLFSMVYCYQLVVSFDLLIGMKKVKF